ncbi:class I poly(R)-hydroxyalkanoic acid synthase [Paracoccus caeni]|uniref:Class I poly(R)-hydroxyalkanoic acid synthase n=2 Tax=Paracoccus caeni TaxID=657651 RepID=A0A934VZZ2_9RHOB|nr:class I poly(R)-hydroxyalkanoic acid synthase [Paracoccus caeni]
MARSSRKSDPASTVQGGTKETLEKQAKVAPKGSATTAAKGSATKVVTASARKPKASSTTKKPTTAAEKPKPARRATAPAKNAAGAKETGEKSLHAAASTTSGRIKPNPDRVAEDSLNAGAAKPAAQKLAENVERIEALGSRLIAAMSERSMPNPGVEGPGTEFFLHTANAWMKTLTEQPSRILEQQVNFWGETLKNYAGAQMGMARGRLVVPENEADEGATDKRFSNALWKSHPYFSFVRKQYLINAKAIQDAVGDLDLSDEVARRRVDWLTKQVIDMMSPTNFLATNPDALERAVATEGESLVKGLENLVRDVEMNGGEMVVSLADRDAFTVGENIGTSEGAVVHRTPMLELLQYKPATDKVHALPLLIFPPWINKFYILDLKPQNSLIRWLVEQGHSVFVVSWKNPDSSYAEVGMEEYVKSYLDVIGKVLEQTGQKKLNAVGYCIAGTTLSLTLSLMKQRGMDQVASATFFTTLTDFSDQGEFVSFLQDDFVNGIAEEVERHGLMRAQLMSRTMSFLRANDLVWGPAIRSYMMGEAPPAFDLLFWNGDSTNLPGKMALQYLKGLCQQNAFAGEGFELLGHKLHLSDVTIPLCSVACESDHIAPWKDCWRGVAQMGSRDKTFILSESGHIAGIVNPPSKKKYGHYIGGKGFADGYQSWRESSSFSDGSWWPHWGEWLASRAGQMIAARDPGTGLEPAPGSYVHERAI